MKSLYKTWLLALLALTLPQIAVAYQIPTTPNGSWTGTGTTVPATPATKDTPSGLRTTVSLTGAAMTFSLRNDTSLTMSGNTTVPLLPATTNGVQVLATLGGGGCNNTLTTCTGLGTMTVNFTDTAGNPISVRNPKIHLSRLGGSVTSGGNTTLITDIFTLTTAGVTLGAPSAGAVNLTVTGGNQIQANLSTMTTTSPGVCPNAGCGTIPVTGTTSQLAFNVGAARNNTLVNWDALATAGDAIFITASFDEDYGDAPASYDVSNAASHIISDLVLGASITAENPNTANGGANGSTTVASSPNAVAAGTSNNGTNGDGTSDDGVSSFPALTTASSGSTYTVPVSLSGASRAGQSCGWIDFNKNGLFDNPAERACATFAIGATSANLTWTVPAGITVGNTYARIRASYDTVAVQNPTGRLSSGEVEDYQIAIAAAPGTISGSLYQDANNDNTLTAGETKLPANVDVELLNSAGTVIATVQTNATGDYTFTNVPVATGYQVRVVTSDPQIPTGYAIRTTNPITGINVTAGTTVANQNFGFITLPLSFGSCGNSPYISYNLPNTLSTLNINTLTLDPVGSSTIPYNAIGYNIVNNLIYGIQRPPNLTTTNSNNLVVVGSNGVPVSLGAVTNLPLTEFYNSGDVGSNNIYYVVNGLIATKTFYRIDLNPASSTYRQRTGAFSLPALYNTTAYSFGDIAFNPVDGQIYAVLNTVVSNAITAQQLAKIDPSSGSLTLLGIATLTDLDSFIGLFVDRTGNIYGYQGIAGKLWRYNSTTGTRVLMKDSLPTANNNADGARCYDSTPLSSSSERPQLLLVKRITEVASTATSGFNDLLTGTGATDDNNPNWPTPLDTYLRGLLNGGAVNPGAEVEYTIYFLNNQSAATNVIICDPVPANMTFVTNGYNSASPRPTEPGALPTDTGIALASNATTLPTSPTVYLTNANDSDRGRYYPPNDPSTPAACKRVDAAGSVTTGAAANTDGVIVVNIVSGTGSANQLPPATAAGDPPNSYGYIRFKTRVK